MEIAGQPKEVWNRSETVWNCRKAAIFADPTFIWKLLAGPKRSETGLKPSETVGKQLYLLILHLYGNCWPAQRGLKQVWNCRKAAISADPTFIWKLLASPKRFETGLKPSVYLLILHLYGNCWPAQRGLKQVWNCRKAAMSADPTFIWKLLASPKRSETGLKPSETVGKQLYLLILHLYGNCWPAKRGLKQVWNRLKLWESSYICWSYIYMDIAGQPKEAWKLE